MLPSIKFQSLATAAQANVPITFGQVFAPGDLMAGRGLIARAADGSYLPLQIDQKATHADGSIRHAIISCILPALAAGETQSFQLLDADKRSSVQTFAGVPASVAITLADVAYTAAIDPAAAFALWLAGPAVNEHQFNVPFTAADGSRHPHLMARYAVRDYGTAKRVDVAIENNWAFEPGPQNFVYDLQVIVSGQVVFSKAALTHLTQARWRKVFWTGTAPQVNVQHDAAYLIATKAVPNYDPAFLPNESTLQRYAAMAMLDGPMQIGAASSYFPTTGGNDEIGILTAWQASWILSMDSRARDCTLVTANGAGSFGINFRDQDTDRPVSLTKYPYMSASGMPSDTWNPVTKKLEAFPAPGGDVTKPYGPDMAHQPSLAYLAYLLTGDYYYLEEMQFWAMWNTFLDNPAYRGAGLGLVHSAELRAQGWGMRTIAQAAAFTPDDHALKADLVGFVNNNLDWYLTTYVNNPSFTLDAWQQANNNLGVFTHGFSLAYGNNTAIAPWMDDFFTSAIGHAVDLGFDKAKPLLAWKAKFPVGRMTAPGVCWITAANYGLQVRPADNTPVYTTFKELLTHQFGDALMAMPCAGPEMAKALGYQVGDMGNVSNGYMGYPSNMQPALAYAVDSGIAGAQEAWDLFMSRSVKPDYCYGSQFSIKPRVTSQPIQGAAPMTTYKLSIVAIAFANQDLAYGTEAATSLLVELLDPNGVVLGSTATIPGDIAGITFADLTAKHTIRASGKNTAGVMGTPALQDFVPQDYLPVVTAPTNPVPPIDPTPTTAAYSLPAAVTFTLAAE